MKQNEVVVIEITLLFAGMLQVDQEIRVKWNNGISGIVLYIHVVSEHSYT